MSATTCMPAGAPSAPSFALPPGACDCHAHVLGPFGRFPLAASRPYDPPEAPLERLREMLATMGLERAVIAHVSAHGMDLSVTLDAMAALGERARGVALLRPDVTDARLQELNAMGMRGMRLSMAYGGETPLNEEHLRLWAARIAPLGWHIAIWPSDLSQLRLLLRLAGRLPAPLVLDHLASHGWLIDGRVSKEGFAVLEDLLATGKVWLKLSGMYRAGAGAPPWQPLVEPMSRLAHRHLRNMLWASDWPYVGLRDPAMRPTSASLVEWLLQLGLDASQRTEVLVRNPERVYGFPPI